MSAGLMVAARSSVSFISRLAANVQSLGSMAARRGKMPTNWLSNSRVQLQAINDPLIPDSAMEHQFENELGYKLKCRLAQFLPDAGFKVIPPGTLGAGMGYRQSDDVDHHYDPETDVLTITGTVTIEVYRAHEDDN